MSRTISFDVCGHKIELRVNPQLQNNKGENKMLKNEIIKFLSPDDGKEIRVVVIDNEPWFVGKDVADELGYSNSKDAIATHVDDDDRKIIQRSEIATLDIPNRGLTIINESGVYSLVFSSKLSKAKRFKHWVTSEVLPSIRKTGSYSISQFNNKPDSYMIEDPVERAKRWIEEYEEKKALELKIEQDKPLVDFATHVSDTSDLIDVGMLAKIAKNEKIKIGRNKLFEWLRDNKYLMSNGIHKNEPYQTWVEQGLFVSREYTYHTPYGEKIGTKVYVTGKGQIHLIEKLRKSFS